MIEIALSVGHLDLDRTVDREHGTSRAGRHRTRHGALGTGHWARSQGGTATALMGLL